MKRPVKITVLVPDDLLRRARRYTGLGITPTVRQGLEQLAAGTAYQRLRGMRGRVKIDLDLEELRKDRR